MNTRPKSFHGILATSIATLLTLTAARAVDYNFGSITENFTLTATDQARALPGGTASGVTFNDNGFGGVYDRGALRDATYMHFDLSSLAGGTINGTVNLNFTIDATYGGAINGGIVGSATNAWSYPGNTGGITTISGADPSGNYSNGQTATAVIDNTTFQGFATNPSTFFGLGITAGAGSTAHFSGPATLTGNATTGLVRVLGGTDWSAAVWNGGTSTLNISGASDVSGGAVTVRSGATIAVTGSATLGTGSFAGSFANGGALAFGSSANQTLSGVISGSGSLTKSGAGTLTLTGSNSYTGGTTISEGTVIAGASGVGRGAVTIASGATLSTTSAASTGLAALYYNIAPNQANIASLPALLSHFGGNSPAPALVNTATSMNFGGNGSGFPAPYNSGGANFEAFYSGKVNIGTAGTYTFNTSSDDGSMLFIDGQVVVTNNFDQAVTTRTGSIALTAGMHDIVIAYNQGGGGYGMNAQISGADNVTMVDINSSNASITPDLVVGSLAGAGSVVLSTGNLITGIDNSSTNFSGVISGIGGVTKFGTGTQTLSGSNTNTGKTTIGGGHVRFANTSGTATVANVELVGPGSFLIMDAANQFGPNAGLLFNSSGGHNEFALYGNNQTIASLASTNQFAVVQNSHGSLGAATASSTLTVNQSTDTTYSGVFRNNTGNDAFTLALVKSGAGKLAITSITEHTGGTTVDGGVLEISGQSGGVGAVRGTVTVNSGGELRSTGGGGAVFGYNGGQKIDTLNINGGLVNNAVGSNHLWNATVNMTGGELRTNGGVSDANTGNYFEWGNTAVNTLASASTATISGRIRIRPDASPVLTFTVADGAAATDLLVSAAITETGASGITKLGAGTMTLTGDNTYTGTTVVNAGTLKLQAGGAPLLTDNFTATGNPNTNDLNYNLANRQTGAAALQNWTPSGNTQVGNPTNVTQPGGTNGDYLLLAFGAQAKLAGLSLSNGNVPEPLKINFDMFKGNTGNATEWTSFTLRTNGDGFPVAGSGELGFLYRNNTGIQIFNNGGLLQDFGSTAGGDSFGFYLADSAGTGSPFAGNGTRVIVTQGGSILGSYTLNTSMAASLIAFGSAGGMIGGVDNLGVNNFKTNVLDPATAVSLTASGAALELDGVIQTVASLSGVSGTAVNLGPFSRLTVNGANSTSFDGVIAGTFGSLGKDGSGTLTLTGANTYTGGTTVSGGTLDVSGNLTGTTNVIVNSGGTLLLSGSGGTNAKLNPAATMNLAGGTLEVSDTISSTLDQTLGTLTLSASSVIDFGTFASGNTFHFADSASLVGSWSGTLSIHNWTDGADHLFFGNGSGTGLEPSQLAQIKFYSDAGSTVLPFAPGFSGFTGGFGEVTPVPEPSSIATAMGLFGLVGWREGRRKRRIA